MHACACACVCEWVRSRAYAPCSVFAVASPRSLWQCVDHTTVSAPGVLAMRYLKRSPYSVGVVKPTCQEEKGDELAS